MEKCKCGSTNFYTTCSMSVELELKNGILTAISEEELGDDGIYICRKCEEEYQRKDFKEINYF